MEISELDTLLKLADPAALLVAPRLLRRVIKRDRQLASIGLQVPHRKSYVIEREPLLQIVDKGELEVASDRELPDVVILIARPDPERLAAMPRAQALLRYWRLLFHCHIHLAFQQRFAEGGITEAGLRRRIHSLGQAEFEEARRVLRQEKYLFSPQDPCNVYEEFAALFLDLRYFSPALLGDFFPSLDDIGRVERLLGEDIDAPTLFARTRLPGALNPSQVNDLGVIQASRDSEVSENPPPLGPPSEEACRAFLETAERVGDLGNAVRSAILRQRASLVSPPEVQGQIREKAAMELERLIDRLRAPLDLTPGEVEEWRRGLLPLLTLSAQGLWPVEARLLYDLQKICLEHERGIYAVDLVEWGLSLGKRPIKRPLPHQPMVLMVKHLRKAGRRLAKTRLGKLQRDQLLALLQRAIHHSEERLRKRFRPLMAATFAKVGMTPRNYPEQVAQHKLIEELLDRITERGFLNIGDLRDAISRNNLKLPDLAGPGEFFRGDPLLRINREFGVVLDGVNQRGEIYMRWLQRLSSLAFGTKIGRFLTRYLALPFGGSFVILEGLQHLVGHPIKKLTGSHLHLNRTTSVVLFGFILLGLLYLPGFRKAVGRVFFWIFRVLKGLCYDLPALVIRQPAIQAVVQSPPVRYFGEYLLTPLVITSLAVCVFLLISNNEKITLAGSATTFLLVFLLCNSRLGRNLEEAFTDWLMRNWNRFRSDVLPGLFRAVMDFFKGMIEVVERILYSIDEGLRFKGGESRLSLVVKAVLGLFWFFVTYIIRFCFNLLIEPQINPIKHFPVVTVSHKLLLPTIPALADVLELTMDPGSAFGAATAIISSIPGIFGFLVWELKENWKL
jgi:hypothetical protein